MKKLTVLFLSVFLVLSIAGCQNTGNTPASDADYNNKSTGIALNIPSDWVERSIDDIDFYATNALTGEGEILMMVTSAPLNGAYSVVNYEFKEFLEYLMYEAYGSAIDVVSSSITTINGIKYVEMILTIGTTSGIITERAFVTIHRGNVITIEFDFWIDQYDNHQAQVMEVMDSVKFY